MSATLSVESPQSKTLIFSVTEETLTNTVAKYVGLRVNGIEDKVGLEIALAARAECRKVRTAIERERKEAKEESLREGQRIDKAAKYLQSILAPCETHLVDEIEAVEKELKAIEDAKIDARFQVRHERLAAAGGAPVAVEYRLMDDANFESFLSQVAEANAERRERERLAKIESDRIAAENAERAEKNRLEQEELRLEREAFAKEKAELDAEKERLAGIERAAQAERERIAKEESDKFANERQAVLQRQAEERDAARKLALLPDVEKIQRFADGIEAIGICELSPEAANAYAQVTAAVAECVAKIRAVAESM